MIQKEWFPDYTWAHFGLLLDASIRGWRDPNATGYQKQGYRFLATIIPLVLQTAERINRSKLTYDTVFPVEGPRKKQDGFFAPDECPDYVDRDNSLVTFLRELSGDEKHALLTLIWTTLRDSKGVLIDQETERIVQHYYYAHKETNEN